MATLIILVNEVLDKCELLCARAKPRYKDLFLSLLVNLTDFMSAIDRPGMYFLGVRANVQFT